MLEQWSGSPANIGWKYQANDRLDVKPVIASFLEKAVHVVQAITRIH
ncbi:hypothetical protein [Brucella sp. NBRC 12953]